MPNDDNQDLNPGTSGDPAGDGQPDNNQPQTPTTPDNNNTDNGDNGGQDETVSIPKSEFEQLKSDKDNYQKAALKYKNQVAELGKSPEPAQGENTLSGDSNDNNNDNNQQDPRSIVQEELRQRDESTQKIMQQRALGNFTSQYDRMQDSDFYDAVVANVQLSGSEIDERDYERAIRRSYLAELDERGELDKELNAERERARRQGRIQAEVDAGRNAGDTGDGRSSQDNTTSLSPEGERMARGMHVDPQKAVKSKYEQQGNSVLTTIDLNAPKEQE